MIRTMYAMALLLLFAAAIGCSASGGVDITTPEEPIQEPLKGEAAKSCHRLLGLYQFIADQEAGTLEVVPLREADIHMNLLPFLEPPPFERLTLEKLEFIGNTVEADIGIVHPLPYVEFTGFDVCGIVMTNGSLTGFSDPDLVMAGPGDTRLLNADGYSRWWNPVEFEGYTDGLLGTPESFAHYNSTINGYKYYSDDLGPSDDISEVSLSYRGMFSFGKKIVRKFIIELGGGLTFNYAVDICWEFPDGEYPYEAPDDFPEDANRVEAWRIEVTELENTLYNDGSEAGGFVKLSINVYDWFNAGLNTVKAESLGNFGAFTSETPTGGGEGYSTYIVNVASANPLASGDIDVLISVISEKENFHGFIPGVNTTSYFTQTIAVSDEKQAYIQVLTPNGGEEWRLESDPEITWNSFNVPGTVFIDYSKDNFVSYIHSIAMSEPNDGTYTWVNIPYDPSDTVRVRVSSTDNPTIFDVSDADFALLQGWARTWGGSGSDEGNGVAVDGTGNVYVTGYFRDTVDFDSGPGVDEHTSNGLHDIFLSKFNSDGEFQWTRTCGGPGNDVGLGVATDSSGNAYVTGNFNGTVDFDPGPAVDEHTTNGYEDIFLSKFNPNGDFLWARTWGGNFSGDVFPWMDKEGGYGVAVDNNGNAYITGCFGNTVDFDPGPGVDEHSTSLALDIFLSKFNSNGDFLWARTWGRGGFHCEYGYGVSADNEGNAYVTGYFVLTVDFDPGPGVDEHSAPNQLQEIFLSKFNPNGDFLWARTWGGYYWDEGYGVAVNDGGDVYVTGYFSVTVDFDPGPGICEYTSKGSRDVFLSEFSSNGDFHWARTWGGSDYDIGYGVAVDDSGNVYPAGRFRYTVDFDPTSGIDNHASNGYEDIFLSKFNPNGDFLWARTLGGINQEWSNGVAIDGSGNAYITGWFCLTVDFDPGPEVDEHTSNGVVHDIFLSKFLPDGNW